MPDIVVNVRRLGEEEFVVGIVREVLMDGSCRIVLGDNGETMTALLDEMDVVAPWKNDKVKIMAGVQCGTTGKLIGVDGSDRIVKVDDPHDHRIVAGKALAACSNSDAVVLGSVKVGFSLGSVSDAEVTHGRGYRDSRSTGVMVGSSTMAEIEAPSLTVVSPILGRYP
nr:putative transcription elongation factor spt5 like 1 [Quercus suber]